MSAAQALSLRDKQVASIKSILSLNQTHEETHDGTQNGIPSTAVGDGEPIWKVLVFDNLGRDVISSVLKVNDLRNHGITIHLSINTTRASIPDVPVIYLVEPSQANIDMINADLSKELYSPAYINFLSSIPRPLLEDFAAQAASLGTAEHIQQLHDQYLNFLVSEPDLFSLGMKDTYRVMNSATTSDEELDTAVDRIVSGLFSVVVTYGSIPIIRCPKAGAAEMIAAKLDRKLRDHVLNSKGNLFSGANQKGSGMPSTRPVLVIVDRNVDLIPMLSHSWTYQSLVHDVLKLRLNRITLDMPADESNPSKGTVSKTYDLTDNDFFWNRNSSLPFPEVAAEIDTELTKYRDETAEVMRKSGVSSLDDLQGDANSSAHHLKAVMLQLPELRERKAFLDMHMSILSALLQGIKDRQLDFFFETEENIQKLTKTAMMDVLKDGEKGKDPMDKLRLFIIWFLSTEQDISRAEMDRFDEQLRLAGADTTPLAYIKRVRELTRLSMISSAPTGQAAPSAGASDLFRGFSAISNRLTDRFKDAGLGANFENLVSGVRNLLPVNKNTTLTMIAESLMDPQNASSSAIAKTEGYMYFDPRSANARGTVPQASQARNQQNMPGGLSNVGRGIEASFGQRRQAFSEAIVFTVGGGSMDEYGNLQNWAKRTSQVGGPGATRRIIYGSSEIINPSEFLTGDLAVLGKESA